ncbi:MAG TPA: glycosyltransferase family 4 protein [Nitrospira sp.]|nr:glycosyltransferase family 4 protein [Nitrospira sp.]
MRILILIDDYLPSIKSGATMIHELGLQFVRQGNEVMVLTPSATISRSAEVSEEQGIQVVRVKTERLKGVSRLRRALVEIALSSTLWRGAGAFLKANPCDLVVYYSPTIFFGPLVKKLKVLWNCRSYLVLRDIFPKWAVDTGVLRKGLPYWYFRYKELTQYRAADVIGVESAGNLAYFSGELAGMGFSVEVLPSWAPANGNGAGEGGYRRQLQLENKVVFFYGGNIGVAQDVDNIVRLAMNLRDHANIFFLLVGEGSEVARLNRCICDSNLYNIKILPAVPQEQYLAMLHEFDVGIVSLHRSLTTHNIPGKLLGYLSCARPVLASLNPGNDIRRVLEEAGAGLCCENGDDQQLREAAIRLANDRELREEMGRNAHRLLETRFSDAAAADQILSHFSTPSVSKQLGSRRSRAELVS